LKYAAVQVNIGVKNKIIPKIFFLATEAVLEVCLPPSPTLS
jgi:hypothetical protein